MSRDIVVIGGSPSGRSRSGFVAHAVTGGLEAHGFGVRAFGLHDFAAEDVFLARIDAPNVAQYIEVVKGAAGIVLATPVYKATYSGALKAIVDLIPQDALIGKPALGIATSKLEAHGREADRAYQALFAFFRARTLPSLLVLDEEVRVDEKGGAFATEGARTRVANVAKDLVDALRQSG